MILEFGGEKQPVRECLRGTTPHVSNFIRNRCPKRRARTRHLRHTTVLKTNTQTCTRTQTPLVASEAAISIPLCAQGHIECHRRYLRHFGTHALPGRTWFPNSSTLKPASPVSCFKNSPTYQLRLVLIVADPQRYGDRFNELARRHPSHKNIRIVHTREEADREDQTAPTLPTGMG